MDRTEIRPLTMAVLMPIRWAWTSQLGQISVSSSTRAWGRDVPRALVTGAAASMGAYTQTASAPNRRWAAARPCSVVVETIKEQSGRMRCRPPATAAAAPTSPTEAAWSQIRGLSVRTPCRLGGEPAQALAQTRAVSARDAGVQAEHRKQHEEQTGTHQAVCAVCRMHQRGAGPASSIRGLISTNRSPLTWTSWSVLTTSPFSSK